MASLPKANAKPRAHGTNAAHISRSAPEKSMSASSVKTHLLELLDTVDRTHEVFIITKRGRPVAKLVPLDTKPARSIFGCMKGTFRITGDIVAPEPDIWEAML